LSYPINKNRFSQIVRHNFAMLDHAFDVQINRFSDIGKPLIYGVTLTDAAGKRWDFYGIAAVGIGDEDNLSREGVHVNNRLTWKQRREDKRGI
jgi:hypothetical protein